MRVGCWMLRGRERSTRDRVGGIHKSSRGGFSVEKGVHLLIDVNDRDRVNKKVRRRQGRRRNPAVECRVSQQGDGECAAVGYSVTRYYEQENPSDTPTKIYQEP